MTNVKTALVIGSGVAGPVAAMALQRAGIEATVYEAHDGPADGVGAMLGLAPNGLNALSVIGADETVRSIGEPVSSMITQSWTGKRLAEFGDAAGPPILHVMWRADLYRALYDEAVRRGVRIEHGRRLTGATDTGESVTAVFADGTRASGDILIGADGIRSAIRSLIDPAAPQPRYTGLLGFGGWVTDTGLAGTGGAMHMIYGKRAFFSYKSYEDGRAGWFANLPRQHPMSAAEAQTVGAQGWLRVLREAFAGDRTPARAILERCDPADLLITGALEGMPPVPTWSRGRMVLIGDAAHATTPSSGQGASQAIESAVQLARCLRDLPVSEAFAAYERLRRPRVERIIATAARTNSDKAAGPIARVLRDLLMPVTMRLLARPEKMAWQFGYRIDWDALAAAPGRTEPQPVR
ncbi:FAD-dependent monooxygenase [Pseudonocardia asaccharolytica]|uniref:FAD-dependent oxidoreductase n=1 Tax=Pseudonocardia asaccharolytica DSM 44247 = NBRC 16224 TaxID=1123024 RepID=A0A511D263_9PSEU|nr:FAD-dependent monooxygenase [Pseudonocardia asaccharolytica]GEL18872.1 FAD-dependent oxidoreductase [Pseudonocardia asaccharolytica DSM 44247 = NBRC 16224]